MPRPATRSALFPPPWRPDRAPGLALWLDAARALYTDTAGTTLATANGNAVRCAPDRSGAGAPLTNAATGAILRIESGGRVLAFEGAGYLARDVTSGPLPSFTLSLVMKPTVPANLNAVFAFGAGAADPIIAPQWINGQFDGYGLVPSNQCAALTHDDPTWRVAQFVADGSTLRTFLDGAEIGPAPQTSQAITGEPLTAFSRAGHAVGGETSFASRGTYRLAELCYRETALPVADLARERDYLRARWARLLNATDPQVVWVGNSLGTGLVVAAASVLPYAVGNASSKVNRWVNASRGGITTPQMLARVAADYAKLAVAPSPRLAVVWEGTNDITLNAASAATAYANLVTLAQALRAVGFTRIVMGTVLPRTGMNNTTRATLNASILANTTDWDAVADVGGDATIGADGADLDTTYYQDGVHLKAAGNAIAAGIFRTAIDGLLP